MRKFNESAALAPTTASWPMESTRPATGLGVIVGQAFWLAVCAGIVTLLLFCLVALVRAQWFAPPPPPSFYDPEPAPPFSWLSTLSSGGTFGLSAWALAFAVSLGIRMGHDLFAPMLKPAAAPHPTEAPRPDPADHTVTINAARAPKPATYRQRLEAFIRGCESNTAQDHWEQTRGLARDDYLHWRDQLIKAGYAAWKNVRAAEDEQYRKQGWALTSPADVIIANLH